jgi:hypothetical protein
LLWVCINRGNASDHDVKGTKNELRKR